MIEFTTITIICILLLLYFRPGKTPPLKNSLVIERTGQYRATLAAQLNLAQPLIEDIAQQLGTVNDSNSATLAFEVRDKQVNAHGHEFYFLAITQRNGMLYFEASNQLPPPPAANPESNRAIEERIMKAVQSVAHVRGIAIKQI